MHDWLRLRREAEQQKLRHIHRPSSTNKTPIAWRSLNFPFSSFQSSLVSKSGKFSLPDFFLGKSNSKVAAA